MYRKLFKQFFTIITLEVLFCTVGADTTVAEGTTDAAGGNMGWFEDALNEGTKAWGNTWKQVTSLGGLAENDVSKFFENEVVNKSDLRAAQVGSFLSGVPYVGDFVRGINGIQQLEDLYNKTGKVPAYFGGTSNGASGVAQGLADAAKGMSRKIEDGTHSLHTFYSGEPELSPWDPNAQVKHAPNMNGWKRLI